MVPELYRINCWGSRVNNGCSTPRRDQDTNTERKL